jgi:hypothetical protein
MTLDMQNKALSIQYRPNTYQLSVSLYHVCKYYYEEENYSENPCIGKRKKLTEKNPLVDPCDHNKKPLGSLKGT